MFKNQVSPRWVLVSLLLGGVVSFQIQQTVDSESEPTAKQELEADLHEILNDPRLESAVSSVHVRSAESGEEIYDYQGQTSLGPASGQKILSGTAALDVLGPEYTFNTGVYTEGHQVGSILRGDLYLKGEGDPTMLPSDYEDFAKELADQNIKLVQGDIIADDTFFDDTRLSLDLSWYNQRRHTGAQVSALSVAPDASLLSSDALDRYNTGSVYIEIHPGDHPGDQAEIEVTPDSDYFTIHNEVETVQADDTRSLTDWGREHGSNEIFFEGTIPVGDNPLTQYVAIWEPTELAQQIFYDALEEHGILVTGDAVTGITPDNANALVERESMPLEELYFPFMKLSQNNHAEHLTKTLGREVHDEGSWDEGLEVVENYLDEAGVDTDILQLRDGSGMSHLNMIPAQEMTHLLHHVQEEDWYEVFYESLPLVGEDDEMIGGTLNTRMQGTEAEGNVRAKTGTTTSKSSLSGYVTTQDDEEFIFSVIINNFTGHSPKDIEDDIAIRLAEFSRD
ncbi:D-alanyl-D-alanine carboxypeptidase/D-alanyl-D-alanine-endopeptidase (penicillin-binding protein 4) [Geomicrobium halophilum]|uniref:D-alanyl-D-alanine carboxypeptidase/D-alanyl-D-alanine-endopeptidase (Penicillin-binding protein 4) n=1 Tax=Geomicrobium halophilum TaxID=549000 RepID=A0A841PZL5_9BACL|nr:D-alanyl-D-alanine carboxypeptidase/D-alanyl-D-alanine-endopeptidase [Geomicrobium halophilum]MBB6448168.1 D-alanyl-D-alanine carboxypeptidase/D-alanyl-D-alanine-endopeptidase (penicillin-binding protein 4) [Geomicrobium halophilum]